MECFSNVFGHMPWSDPKSVFRVLLGTLGAKNAKEHSKALFGALRGKCPKSLEKHSVGHFQARAPEHSCKWRPGSQSKPTTEFAQPHFSRSNGGHPQREGTNLGVCLFLYGWDCPGVRLQIWVCLICVISPHSNGAVQIRVGLESIVSFLSIFCVIYHKE